MKMMLSSIVENIENEEKISSEELSEIRAALEPVADWYDIDGNEGEKPDLSDVVADVASDLVADRKENIELRRICRKIVEQGLTSSDGRNAIVADDLINDLVKVLV